MRPQQIRELRRNPKAISSRRGRLGNLQCVWITWNALKGAYYHHLSAHESNVKILISGVACQKAHRNERMEREVRVFICPVRMLVLIVLTYPFRKSKAPHNYFQFSRFVERQMAFPNYHHSVITKTNHEIFLGAISTDLLHSFLFLVLASRRVSNRGDRYDEYTWDFLCMRSKWHFGSDENRAIWNCLVALLGWAQRHRFDPGRSSSISMGTKCKNTCVLRIHCALKNLRR